jgi:hypothetical protein
MRFSGTVGYAVSTQTAPGVWKDVITEKKYYGDVTRNARRLVPPLLVPPELNSNLALENSFSILADADAYANYKNFRYVTWEGNRWTITNVEVSRPRLILTIGELWNGDTP